MILVTGGAGFIGSNLVAALAGSGCRVVVCDRLRAGGKWRNLRGAAVFRFVCPEDLPAWLATGPTLDAIVHLGAISATTATDGDLVMRTNPILSRVLWDWCAQRGVRFIYASSAATYGDGSAGFDDDAAPAALARLLPLNLYGWSKHVFDQQVALLLARGDPAPPQWAGLKFFNVYGPNEDHKEGMISVPRVKFAEVAAGGPARLFRSDRPDVADGEQKRDFIHVDDCVAVIRWLLDSPSVSGLFNVGTGRARSFLDLAQALFAAMGRPVDIAFVPMPVHLRGQYQSFTQARMDRLRAAGYAAPFIGLEDGVARYVRHLRAS